MPRPYAAPQGLRHRVPPVEPQTEHWTHLDPVGYPAASHCASSWQAKQKAPLSLPQKVAPLVVVPHVQFVLPLQ